MRVKGASEASKSFRRLTNAREWLTKQMTAMQQREAIGSVKIIWFHKAEAEALRVRAFKERQSESALVREAVRRFLGIESLTTV